MLPASWLSSLGEVLEAVAAGAFSPPPRAELIEDLGIEYALSRKGRVSGAGRAVLESEAGRGTYLNGV